MKKKKIPTGVVNFKELKENNYYVVDKSMMISDFMDRGSKVTLITRPRRFGKTLNMNMMSEFFDITKDSKEIFKNTDIMKTEYAKELNQYPTIFISFASAKGNIINIIKFIKLELSREFQKYKHIFDQLDEYDKPIFVKIKQGIDENDNGTMEDVGNALNFLTKQLELYYHKKVMLFIDEYDTPFIEAHVKEYYESIKSGLVSLLQSALKDNNHLQYAMLTGIQRVAKENMFSELNNLDVYTVREKDYAQYFGFTTNETRELLEYYDLEYNDEVKEMYDGYRIGGIEVYNPWSIINYAKQGELRTYWVNTSSNVMIKKAMERSNAAFKDGYELLIQQGYLDTEVNMDTSFYEQSNTGSLWGLFVNAGYLTIIDTLKYNQNRVCIPNNEVKNEFLSLTAHYINVSETTLYNMVSALEREASKEFIKCYETMLLQATSSHDFKNENSYHVFLLGMCMALQGDYRVTSNRESGKGRNDILLEAKRDDLSSFVIEFKYMKVEDYKKKPERLKVLAQEGYDQISREKYDCELTGNITHIVLAHAGKAVEMIWKKQTVNNIK